MNYKVYKLRICNFLYRDFFSIYREISGNITMHNGISLFIPKFISLIRSDNFIVNFFFKIKQIGTYK